MCEEDVITPKSSSVRNKWTRPRTLVQPCPKLVNFFLKLFATGQVVTVCVAGIVSYTQTANMIFQKCAEDLVANSC